MLNFYFSEGKKYILILIIRPNTGSRYYILGHRWRKYFPVILNTIQPLSLSLDTSESLINDPSNIHKILLPSV